MDFFDFADESLEAATSAASRPAAPSRSPASAPRSTSGTAARSTASSSGAARPSTTTSKPTVQSSPSGGSAAKPAGGGVAKQPVTGPAKPGPTAAPTPARQEPSSPSKPSGLATAKTLFDGFMKYAPTAFDFATDIAKKFDQGGGKISGAQAWDIARGAAQQVATIATDQQAAPQADAGQPTQPGAWSPLAAQPAYPAYPVAQPAYPGATAPQPGGLPQAGADTIGLLLQALQQRQIPPLPGAYAQPPAAPAQPPQQNALALLSLMLTNPNLQRAFQTAHTTGAAPRTVQLPVPTATTPPQTRPVQIPLGAVMNAIAALAGQSMTELNESTSEDEPEVPSYLVGDDGDFLVDPSSPTDRAALVGYLFRMSDEAERAGFGRFSEDEGQDETEVWAGEAGLI